MGAASPPRPVSSCLTVRVVAWSIGGLAITLALAGAVLHLIDRQITTDLTQWWLTNVTEAVCLGVLGGLLASRRPHNPIGWIFLSIAMAQALTASGREYALWTLAVHHGTIPGGVWTAWIGEWAWEVSFLSVVVVLLFPTGRLPSARWWPLLVVTVAASGLGIFGSAVYPGPVLGGPGLLNSPNPATWTAGAHFVDAIGWNRLGGVLTACSVLSCLALILRLRRASQPERGQLTVVAIPAMLAAAEFIWEFWQDNSLQPFLSTAGLILLTASIATAILRYGLFDIDLVVRRAIVFTTASLLLLASYIAVVELAAGAIGHRSRAASALAVAVVALLFAPLRLRLQRATDRLLYGARRDPYAVMTSIGEQLPASGAALPALAATVARTLRLPFVAIDLSPSGAVAMVGADRHGEPLVVPLVVEGRPIGSLTLGRRDRDPFAPDERRLFDDLARQVAVAAHAVQLTADLQRSREQLVATREEERRRIRRDLHDGLGPTLAGIALQLDAARGHLAFDVETADAMLGDLVSQTQASIADIRRLVDALRPAALDELGLESALREQARRFPGMQVEVISAGTMSELPAAVEVAAYRIATEAVTNAARHSAASRCTVRLDLNGALHLEIADDGSGMAPGWQPGVGVTSIHERAAELGGSCTMTSGPAGGTIVHALLPVAAA